MKRYAKIVCVILVLSIVLAVPVAAETENQARGSSFFSSISTYLYQVSSTKFQVWFDLVATERMDELGVCEIEIQRSSDGSDWDTMFTCWPQYYSQMIASNTGSYGSYVPYTGTQGYYYRALVTFYAKKSGLGTGKMDRYTQTLYLPTN